MTDRCPHCRSDKVNTSTKRCEICGSKEYRLLVLIPLGWLYEHEHKQLVNNLLILLLISFIFLVAILIPYFILS